MTTMLSSALMSSPTGLLGTGLAIKPGTLSSVASVVLSHARTLNSHLERWLNSSVHYNVGHGTGCQCQSCQAIRHEELAW